MEEQSITLDTAKLAKEKGFKELCFNYYNLKKELQEPYLENGSSTDVDFRVDLEDLLEQHNNPYHNTYSAPTQALLQKWLREKHNLHIQPIYSKSTRYCIRLNDECENAVGNMFEEYFETYEKALEAGLIEALNLIPI